MNIFVLSLFFFQTLGACIGVFTAIWGELAYIHAMRDGRIDDAEKAHLRIIGKGLRFGMIILLIASVLLVIVSYLLHAAVQPALTESYWVFMTLAFVIIALSWALSRKHISFSFGSAAAMTAWWLIAYLTLDLLPVSYSVAIAFYVVLTSVIYFVLFLIRLLAQRLK